MLNALDKFAAFAAAPVLFNLAQIVFLGIAFMFPTPGHAMAWADIVIRCAATYAVALVLATKTASVCELIKPVVTEKMRRL